MVVVRGQVVLLNAETSRSTRDLETVYIYNSER